MKIKKSWQNNRNIVIPDLTFKYLNLFVPRQSIKFSFLKQSKFLTDHIDNTIWFDIKQFYI